MVSLSTTIVLVGFSMCHERKMKLVHDNDVDIVRQMAAYTVCIFTAYTLRYTTPPLCNVSTVSKWQPDMARPW